MGDAIECRIEQLQLARLPQIGRAVVGMPDVVGVLRGGQQLEEFDGPGAIAGGVAGGLLEHRGRPFAAAETERIRDPRTMAEFRFAANGVQPAHAQQIAQIRNDPFLARFDEPVVV